VRAFLRTGVDEQHLRPARARHLRECRAAIRDRVCGDHGRVCRAERDARIAGAMISRDHHDHPALRARPRRVLRTTHDHRESLE
jgi:hypothetical protein